jgi:hypothetical protein
MDGENELVVVDMPVNIEQAIATLPKELQPTCRRLKELLGEYRSQNLENVYRVGEVVREGMEKLAKKQKGRTGALYGTSAIKRWEGALGVPARSLYHAMALAQRYTREELQQLVKTDRFTERHFIHLQSVKDPLQRRQWEKQVIAQRWSAGQLAQEIRGTLGNRRPGSGRRPKATKDFSEALGRLTQGLQQSRSLLAGTLFGDEFDISNAIFDTPPSEWSLQKLGEIRQTADMLDELGKTAQRNAAALRDAGDVVEDILNTQQQKAAVAAEEDAASVAAAERG